MKTTTEQTGAIVQGSVANFAALVRRDSAKLERALKRSGIDAQAIVRFTLGQMNSNPTLAECEPRTVFNWMIECGVLGLDPTLDEVYAVPYRVKARGYVCTRITGYKGLISLCMRSGHVCSMDAQLVHQNDKFEYSLGLVPKLEHVPASGERGEIVGAYAVAHMRDGPPKFEYMPVEEIDKIRAGSKGKDGFGWRQHYGQMCRKTVIRRLSNYLPKAVRAVVMKAIKTEEEVEFHGKEPTFEMADLLDVQDAESEPVPEGGKPVDVPGMKKYLLSLLRKMDPEQSDSTLFKAGIDTLTECESAELLRGAIKLAEDAVG